jgi:hypothetical protein
VPNRADAEDLVQDTSVLLWKKSSSGMGTARVSALDTRRCPVSDAQFGYSAKTIKRDLEALRDAGQIEFVDPPPTGHYRLKITAKPR